MKKIIALSVISSIGLTSFLANANESEKNGVYVTGKMGASIIQMSGQKLTYTDYEDPEWNERYNGDSHRTGVFGGGIALGYDFSSEFDLPIRAELDFTARGKASSKYNLEKEINEYGSETSDAKNQIKLNTLMVNAYYDFKNESSFTPYVSVGLGYASINQKTTLSYSYSYIGAAYNDSGSYSRSHTSNNFAWSVGAGVKYAMNDNFDLDFSYRYLDAGKASVSYSDEWSNLESKVKVKTNDLMLGVTYKF
ncbi:outer membrane protein [Proteus mirabilis]|uniref:outer membrane protein n=1 Tax=Providencia stuartii TaxID=588 RepID=UPI001121B324|nr:outer membrane protein [Providencia stuartii]EKW9422691.1 porin family protein [Proteus mirabilis]